MDVAEAIESRLRRDLAPTVLEIVNESGMHNVAPGSETHFRVVVVADCFVGLSRIARHRRVYAALEDVRANGLHALGIQTMTPAEFEQAQARVQSPPCLGGDGTLEPGNDSD